MWRAYGGHGNGAALVFKTDFLTEPQEGSLMLIGKIHYASGKECRVWLEEKIRSVGAQSYR